MHLIPLDKAIKEQFTNLDLNNKGQFDLSEKITCSQTELGILEALDNKNIKKISKSAVADGATRISHHDQSKNFTFRL